MRVEVAASGHGVTHLALGFRKVCFLRANMRERSSSTKDWPTGIFMYLLQERCSWETNWPTAEVG